MKKVFVAIFTLLVVLVLTTTATERMNGFDCEKAKKTLVSCIDFIVNKVDQPSVACCKGVREVKLSLPTREDRIAACECLAKAWPQLPNLNGTRAFALPKICGAEVGFSITKNFNCSSIS
ncbi:hypothetical protein VNO78_30594 [Psophocarpus tetragonolobus]|uniref:Bifunctional inhibitor/plant lipid transfer protein/seed storage helical domain-containing protein n=1 Tax=Psophocarpus tetragonolobus TaxID=3891 RepID=A0AAN9RX58_PSOTE